MAHSSVKSFVDLALLTHIVESRKMVQMSLLAEKGKRHRHQKRTVDVKEAGSRGGVNWERRN